MSRVVEFSKLAREDIEAADAWWRVNRPTAPDAVLDEISRAVKLLGESPGIGVAIRGTRSAEVRRIVLRQISYVLYYQVTRSRVEILRVWHGSRRTRPRL